MSRLEKQLDRVSNEQLVWVDWPEKGSVDLEVIRATLVQEINSHRERIPLDLRGVKGAPPELVGLLVDMRRYAVSKSKTLSIARVLPPLRDALEARENRGKGRRVAPSADPNQEAASDKAKAALASSSAEKEFDPATVEVIKKHKSKPATKKRGKKKSNFAKIGAVIFGATLLIVAVEAIVLFQQEESIVLPEKGFEQDR